MYDRMGIFLSCVRNRIAANGHWPQLYRNCGRKFLAAAISLTVTALALQIYTESTVTVRQNAAARSHLRPHVPHAVGVPHGRNWSNCCRIMRCMMRPHVTAAWLPQGLRSYTTERDKSYLQPLLLGAVPLPVNLVEDVDETLPARGKRVSALK